MRRCAGSAPGLDNGRRRQNGSFASYPAMTESTAEASSVVSAKIDMQSSVRHAGTKPALETSPRLGFRPTMLVNIAGMRPEPAVSVPSVTGTRPVATATPEPELDPPGINAGSRGLRGTP